MPIFTNFISAFLTRMEERHCVAYIPCRRKNFDGHGNAADCGEPVGQSGVTIGAGLDLGQQSEADLRRMGLERELIDLFRPYLGKKRISAMQALAAAHEVGYPVLLRPSYVLGGQNMIIAYNAAPPTFMTGTRRVVPSRISRRRRRRSLFPCSTNWAVRGHPMGMLVIRCFTVISAVVTGRPPSTS